MKSNTASFSMTTTLQTRCMWKCKNSPAQGGHQSTAQVCDLASPNTLGKGSPQLRAVGSPVQMDGGKVLGPAVGQSIDRHSLFR